MSKQENDYFPKIVIVVFSLSLLLSILNFFVFSSPSSIKGDVLGTSTITQEMIVWEKYLAYNPDYLPGWKKLLELGKENQNGELIEKASLQIVRLDPNYSF